MEASSLPSTLCVFEDERFPNFFPLSLGKPVFDLRIGTQTLLGRIIDEIIPKNLVLLCRPYLSGVVSENAAAGRREPPCTVNAPPGDNALFINGRILAFDNELKNLCASLSPGAVMHKKGVCVAASLSGEQAAAFFEYLSQPLTDEEMLRVVNSIKETASPSTSKKKRADAGENESAREEALTRWCEAHGISLLTTEVRLLSQYWQLIGENKPCIVDDFSKSPLRGAAPEANLFKGVDLINEDDIVIGSDVEVRSGTVLDASEGPIVIADGVHIEPNAILYGPCFIGERSIIRGGAKIGHGTSIGAECRIGGEVEETVIASFSNKQHEGFLGHSYVGSWVNLGAGCCNSDLKNNYSVVRAWSRGSMRETGRRFLGTVIADHSKLAINTRINTGTVIGFNANVLTSSFPPKFVSSFTWSLEPEYEEYDLERAIATAKIMMDRRNVVFTATIEDLFRVIFRFCRQSGHTI